MKSLIASILLLLANTAMAENSVTVETDPVLNEEVVATMKVSGVVVSRQDATLASELEGRVTWVAEVGERVTTGDVLVRLDTHLLEMDRRNREAELKRLQANLDWLSRQTGRLEELATRNNTAHAELDEVRSTHGMLTQELTQARVALERSIYDIGRSELKAPFSGVIVSREVAIGEYTTAGRPLLRLVNTKAAEISVTAPLRLARYVRQGDIVSVAGEHGAGKATVRSIITVGDIRSHMMELRLLPQQEQWLIGEATSVSLPAGQHRLLTTVDRDALVLRDHSNFVYVVDPQGRAERIPVAVGDGFGPRIAVSGKLTAGDQVIIRGAERLQPGQKVEPLSQQLSMR